MADIVNGILVRAGQVLMARRTDNRATYPGTWSFPGGHVEDGETQEQALGRELTEEIGVEPLSWRRLDAFRFRDAGATFHLFAVDRWRGTPANLGTEHSRIAWFTPDEARGLPGLTFPIYADLLRMLEAG